MVQGREHLHNDAPYLYRQPFPQKRNGCPHNNVAKKTRHQSSESSGDESREYGNTDSMSEDDLEDSVASCKRMVSQSAAVIGDPNQESAGLMNDIRCPGQAEYKIPDCLELKGWILKDEVKEIQEYVQKIRHFIADCPEGPIYLHSCDVSASVGDVNTLQLLLDRVMYEFMERWKSVFWTVNASHCIELMLDEVANMGDVRRTLEKAKTISKFIHGHVTVLNLWRDYMDGHDHVKPTKIKSAVPFVTLENIISEKRNITAMFTSSAWNNTTWSSTVEGKRVAKLVGDASFWRGAGMIVLNIVLSSANVNLAMWWSPYGGEYPELQRFATRKLSQTCVGASKYRLNRSLAEKLLTKGRDRTEEQLLSDLTFVHYNLQLQQQHSQLGVNYDIVADEIGPMNEWIVDDTAEIGSDNGDSTWKDLESAVNGEGPSFEVKEEP
ncbi:hypothetical protein Golax_007644, partial [Gossypium laxum]|nr:hypothetical protein [Gossypium laxum]